MSMEHVPDPDSSSGSRPDSSLGLASQSNLVLRPPPSLSLGSSLDSGRWQWLKQWGIRAAGRRGRSRRAADQAALRRICLVALRAMRRIAGWYEQGRAWYRRWAGRGEGESEVLATAPDVQPYFRSLNTAFLERVRKAQEEWQLAQAHFEEVADPLLVDHAAYWIKEAEKRYILLFQQARQQQRAEPSTSTKTK